MSRINYKAIADALVMALKHTKGAGSNELWVNIITAMCDCFAQDNSKFSRLKWLDYVANKMEQK